MCINGPIYNLSWNSILFDGNYLKNILLDFKPNNQNR